MTLVRSKTPLSCREGMEAGRGQRACPSQRPGPQPASGERTRSPERMPSSASSWRLSEVESRGGSAHGRGSSTVAESRNSPRWARFSPCPARKPRRRGVGGGGAVRLLGFQLRARLPGAVGGALGRSPGTSHAPGGPPHRPPSPRT